MSKTRRKQKKKQKQQTIGKYKAILDTTISLKKQTKTQQKNNRKKSQKQKDKWFLNTPHSLSIHSLDDNNQRKQ